MDHLGPRAAGQLALKIQHYWTQLGLTGVHVWAEPVHTVDVDSKEQVTVYQVRSNIVELIRESSYRHALLRRTVATAI